MNIFLKGVEQTLKDYGIPLTPELIKFSERISTLPMLDVDTYTKLHTSPIVPLNIKINVDLFRTEIQQYKLLFRRWGKDKMEYPRYGIPLVNLTGNLDDKEDPSCWPLDKWIAANPKNPLWETDFKTNTDILRLSSLTPLQCIEPYMIRSNILLWHREGFFSPHVDMLPNAITHLRLWGITEDCNGYELAYGDDIIRDIEPGRLYLIDTMRQHRARAMKNGVYTFFIAVDINILNILPSLLMNDR